MEKRKGTGDCFVVAAETVLKLSNRGRDNETYRLVHGLAFGKGGSAKGLRYCHAWVEVNDEFVLDFSNGNNVAMLKSEYYTLGQIETVKKYTPKEMMQLLYDTENYGPWDEAFNDYP